MIQEWCAFQTSQSGLVCFHRFSLGHYDSPSGLSPHGHIRLFRRNPLQYPFSLREVAWITSQTVATNQHVFGPWRKRPQTLSVQLSLSGPLLECIRQLIRQMALRWRCYLHEAWDFVQRFELSITMTFRLFGGFSPNFVFCEYNDNKGFSIAILFYFYNCLCICH